MSKVLLWFVIVAVAIGLLGSVGYWFGQKGCWWGDCKPVPSESQSQSSSETIELPPGQAAAPNNQTGQIVQLPNGRWVGPGHFARDGRVVPVVTYIGDVRQTGDEVRLQLSGNYPQGDRWQQEFILDMFDGKYIFESQRTNNLYPNSDEYVTSRYTLVEVLQVLQEVTGKVGLGMLVVSGEQTQNGEDSQPNDVCNQKFLDLLSNREEKDLDCVPHLNYVRIYETQQI